MKRFSLVDYLGDDQLKARHRWVSDAAYYKALHRGFVPGFELQDWLSAENDFTQMLIVLYLSVIEEDGIMTIVSLQQLAEAVGVQDSQNIHSSTDLIHAIQAISGSNPCFQFDANDLCETSSCQWKNECRKMIAIWMR